MVAEARASFFAAESLEAMPVSEFRAMFDAAGTDIDKLIELQTMLMVEIDRLPKFFGMLSPQPIQHHAMPSGAQMAIGQPLSTVVPAGVTTIATPQPMPTQPDPHMRRRALEALLRSLNERLDPLKEAIARQQAEEEAKRLEEEAAERFRQQQLEIVQEQHRLQTKLEEERIKVLKETERRQRILSEGGFYGRGGLIAMPSGETKPAVSDRIKAELLLHRAEKAKKARLTSIALVAIVIALLIWWRK